MTGLRLTPRELLAEKETSDRSVHCALFYSNELSLNTELDRVLLLVSLEQGDTRLYSQKTDWACLTRGPFSLTVLPDNGPYLAVPEKSVQFLVMSCASAFVSRLSQNLFGGEARALEPISNVMHSDIPPLTRVLRRYLLDPHCGGDSYIQSLTMALLSHALVTQADPAGSQGHFDHDLLENVLDVMDDDTSLSLSIAEIADQFDLPQASFSRLFKGATGTTPRRYLLERRIAFAQRQMHETDAPIVDIALAAGFSSQPHFTTTFKELVGVTPAIYIERYCRRSRG